MRLAKGSGPSRRGSAAPASNRARSSGASRSDATACTRRARTLSGKRAGMLAAPGSKIVGAAVTLRQVPKNAGEDRETRLTRHQEVSGKIAQKGDVVVVDNGGRLDTATWGEFHGYACKRNGVAGAIIDGATRDGPEIRNSGFPTFVRGLTPVSSKWELKTASINEPVMLGPVQVNPGDIMFADETGILVIPAAKKELVLCKANEIRAAEDGRRAEIV
jgi:4-hydroxy-4-methyl-2-oxoglutarate aldolase